MVKRLSIKSRRGAPRVEDRNKTIEHRKPWIKLGMSRRTWYRRKREKEQRRKRICGIR